LAADCGCGVHSVIKIVRIGPRLRRWHWAICVAVIIVVVVVTAVALVSRRASTGTTAKVAVTPKDAVAATATTGLRFVGSDVCVPCHSREAVAWQTSHHRLAMQPANSSTVLGDFADAAFTHAGVSSKFFHRDGKYMVRTDGPDGTLHDYAITHTFGVSPLQQYLVAFPGGRWQALEIAWDSRPAAAGGQRWFHLYPAEKFSKGDPLHWTGAAENWNYMCADCHSTNVRKSWNAATAVYSTSSAETSVSCEACHGPGSGHVAWAREPPGRRPRNNGKGLVLALDERSDVFWARDPATGKPSRSRPRVTEREMEVCARCHSRRGLIHEDHVHGQPVEDDYRVALLDDDLYHPDGQVKGEVYEYGSFVQSRMYAEGVTCSDCHDPHRPELRASGNEVCVRCHAEQTYLTAKHHFHREGSSEARCVGCHMPKTTFMVVDARRDHSLRVPRPDLSVKLGVPNACNDCHTDRSAEWAAGTVQKWYGHTPNGFQRFAEALAAGTNGAPGAQRLLVALAADDGQPAIARASALSELGPASTPSAILVARKGLLDASPLVRRAAVQALAGTDPAIRAPLLLRLLDDKVRSVRIEAASALAGVPVESIPDASRSVLAARIAEFVAAQELQGDRPEAHLNLAALHASRRDFSRAEAELEKALSIEPRFVPAAVNLADLYRVLGRDDDAEAVLRRALERVPDEPTLLYDLGLVLVRAKRSSEALECLRLAARFGPDDPRRGYTYGVALHDTHHTLPAIKELEKTFVRHPFDRNVLSALSTYWREVGNFPKAVAYAKRLHTLDEQDTDLVMR
jgi:predicted CXXCH cytochrome family protein